jgi:hypothetical protein
MACGCPLRILESLCFAPTVPISCSCTKEEMDDQSMVKVLSN